MPQPTNIQRSPGLFMALWSTFITFIGNLFGKSPSAATLPDPVTARSPKLKSNTSPARTTKETHQRTSLAHTTWVKASSPLKPLTCAANSPTSFTARTAPACRSRSTTPKRSPTDPEHILHPPSSPFPNISLSGIFITPLLLSSPRLASNIELARLSLASPPEVQASTPLSSPGNPSPFRGSHGSTTPLFHAHHSRSPYTPRTPSSAVIVQLDRSAISPTTMSDGSLEVISLGDRRGLADSPIKVADMGPLPSPWSPVGKTASLNIWMSVDGMLVNATGPVDDLSSQSQDDTVATRSAVLSSPTLSRISTTSLYSSSSVLDALCISAFVSLDRMEDHLSEQGTRDDPTKSNKVHNGSHATLVTQEPQTPRKRRQTLPFVTRSRTPSHNSRTTKCLSTPFTKADNAGIGHVHSASSISSMAYELRLGLFADGKSMTTIGNIISLLDQASPESILPHHDSVQFVETV